MKKIFLFLLVIIVIVAGGTLLFEKMNPKIEYSRLPIETPTPTVEQSPLPTSTDQLLCSPTDMEALISLEGAAGSIEGTLTLKNISSTKCTIQGGKFVIPQYTADNITVIQKGLALPIDSFELVPGQFVNFQVRMQNGPQCSGSTQKSSISFTYPITSSQSVVFLDDQGSATQQIQVCSSAAEKTEVDVSSFSIVQ